MFREAGLTDPIRDGDVTPLSLADAGSDVVDRELKLLSQARFAEMPPMGRKKHPNREVLHGLHHWDPNSAASAKALRCSGALSSEKAMILHPDRPDREDSERGGNARRMKNTSNVSP